MTTSGDHDIDQFLSDHGQKITQYRKKRKDYLSVLYDQICKHIAYHIKPSQTSFVITPCSIYFVDLGINIGSEQNKVRPCVVISKKRYNNGDTVTIIPLTSSRPSAPCAIAIKPDTYNNLTQESRALISQIRTISKRRILGHCGTLDPCDLSAIQQSLIRYLGLIQKEKTPHEEMSF